MMMSSPAELETRTAVTRTLMQACLAAVPSELPSPSSPTAAAAVDASRPRRRREDTETLALPQDDRSIIALATHACFLAAGFRNMHGALLEADWRADRTKFVFLYAYTLPPTIQPSTTPPSSQAEHPPTQHPQYEVGLRLTLVPQPGGAAPQGSPVQALARNQQTAAQTMDVDVVTLDAADEVLLPRFAHTIPVIATDAAAVAAETSWQAFLVPSTQRVSTTAPDRWFQNLAAFVQYVSSSIIVPIVSSMQDNAQKRTTTNIVRPGGGAVDASAVRGDSEESKGKESTQPDRRGPIRGSPRPTPGVGGPIVPTRIGEAFPRGPRPAGDFDSDYLPAGGGLPDLDPGLGGSLMGPNNFPAYPRVGGPRTGQPFPGSVPGPRPGQLQPRFDPFGPGPLAYGGDPDPDNLWPPGAGGPGGVPPPGYGGGRGGGPPGFFGGPSSNTFNPFGGGGMGGGSFM